MSYIRFGSERRFLPGTSESYVYAGEEGIVWYGDDMDDLVEICCRQMDRELALAVAEKYLELQGRKPSGNQDIGS